jgi:hypothetical protein
MVRWQASFIGMNGKIYVPNNRVNDHVMTARSVYAVVLPPRAVRE